MPEMRKIDDKKAMRAAAIAELRAAANRARADRPGWSRVYVTLAALDELEGLNDSALTNYKEAIDKGERQEYVIRRAIDLYRERRQEDQAALLLNFLHTEIVLPDDLERFRAIKDLLARDIPASERPTIDRIAPGDSKEWRILLLRGSLLAAIGADNDARVGVRRRRLPSAHNVPETWGAPASAIWCVWVNWKTPKRATKEADRKIDTNPPKTLCRQGRSDPRHRRLPRNDRRREIRGSPLPRCGRSDRLPRTQSESPDPALPPAQRTIRRGRRGMLRKMVRTIRRRTSPAGRAGISPMTHIASCRDAYQQRNAALQLIGNEHQGEHQRSGGREGPGGSSKPSIRRRARRA